MNLFIIVHVSKTTAYYRATAKDMDINGLGHGWSTNIDRAEVYDEGEVPDAFKSMARRVELVDGKVVVT